MGHRGIPIRDLRFRENEENRGEKNDVLMTNKSLSADILIKLLLLLIV